MYKKFSVAKPPPPPKKKQKISCSSKIDQTLFILVKIFFLETIVIPMQKKKIEKGQKTFSSTTFFCYIIIIPSTGHNTYSFLTA